MAQLTWIILIMYVGFTSLCMDLSRLTVRGTNGLLTMLGFVASHSDVSLFALLHGDELAFLLLYVDYIILTASMPQMLQHITELLHSEFSMTDLEGLSYFLGILVTRSYYNMFLYHR
jgi:hypothetical protein